MGSTIVVKAKAKKNKRLDAAALKAKYPHMVEGTLRYNELAQKQEVDCKCECGATFHAFTSDLFQLKSCPECRAKAKKEKRKASGGGRSAITQEKLDSLTPEEKALAVKLGLAEIVETPDEEPEITEEEAVEAMVEAPAEIGS